jgi:acyl phosphate:glycerol-3-phosphate acyltransferase
MIINTVISGIIAVVLGYLIGSIPSAYIVTRIVRGKDIRTIGTGHTGTGNVGTRNVFVNVGKIPGVIVAIIDIAKGVGAVAIPQSLMGLSLFWVLGAGLAAVIGHIWPVYLKFQGGAGLATTLGVLGFLMIKEMAIAISFAIILFLITKNIILSMNLSVLIVSLILWWLGFPWYVTLYPVILMLIMGIHFMPNITAEFKKAGSWENLINSLLRRDRPIKR